MLSSVILLIVLIFINAAFASAEIAVISLNDVKLKKLAPAGEKDKRVKRLNKLTKQPARFLATIQVAITFASLLQSAFAADKFAEPLAFALLEAGVPLSQGVLETLCIIVITIILSYFSLVFGELVPKRIAMKKAEALALGMSGVLYGVSKIFAPLVWLLTVSTNGILRLMKINPEEEEEKVTEEEIRGLLLEGNEQGTIQSEENEIIQNVFEFDDTDVQEICTHRREIVALHMEDDEEDWAQTIFENRHTFYPICDKTMDDVIGILDTRDYFRMSDRSKENLIAHAMQMPLFIPETMTANVLFRKMKESRTYFAVIVDEYGGLTGIITLHDIMESLVGDLEEKNEPPRPSDIEQLKEDEWSIQGCAPLDDVAEELDAVLPTDTYDTFGGYICGMIDRVPNDGERFRCESEELVIDVMEVENHTIGATVVKRKEKAPDEDENTKPKRKALEAE